MGNNQSKKISNSLFIEKKYTNNRSLYNINNRLRIKSGAIQGEFGEKKFIKPWRTGTKSQQQIPPRGQRKGFRGKTQSLK